MNKSMKNQFKNEVLLHGYGLVANKPSSFAGETPEV